MLTHDRQNSEKYLSLLVFLVRSLLHRSVLHRFLLVVSSARIVLDALLPMNSIAADIPR